jgi:DNA-binding IclR family transcriptional regulator
MPNSNPDLAKQNSRDFSHVQVISRAVAILRTVRDKGSLNLSQLAKEVKLARSTVSRIVSSLESEGLLSTAAPDGRVQLGLELVSLGAAVRTDVRRELRPFLEELSLRVDETVDLAILEKDHILFLDQVTRLKRLHAVSGIGIKFPLHCTANGKVLLAALPTEEVIRILPARLQAYTPNTIQNRQQLLHELKDIQATGIAYDREEHTLGICAVGMAIRAPKDTLAAITIPVPSVRFDGKEEILVAALIQTSQMIHNRFGAY